MIRLIVAGAGSRGSSYARYVENHPGDAALVGVAEPREYYRERVAATHGIAKENVFSDWRRMAERPRFADAAVVTTQDAMHREPAVSFMEKGYHILLEKPMAPTAEDCRAIVETAKKTGVIFAVCHVLRYTSYTQKVKDLVDGGAVGQVVSMQHLEPVGYWHQAHSFVRGNWRNEGESSPMLLAKSCHDLDWISYILGDRRCERLSSFGSLSHFRRDRKPFEAGDATRCLECPFEPRCPYSARRIYVERAANGYTGWPVHILTPDLTVEGVTKAVREGPYGRCVYECDNDVVDHQVVNMEFQGGVTATFTMTAFTPMGGRRTQIFGSRGSVYGDSTVVEGFDFLTEGKTRVDTSAADQSAAGGHGGGDERTMAAFIRAVATEDPGKIHSGPDISLETHLMVFAAERARRENRVVEMSEMR